MLGAADAPTAALFFCLLKADAGSALEGACARFANLPSSLSKDAGLSHATLDAALASLTTAAGVGRAGLPPNAGRAAALSAHGYRAESVALVRSGRSEAALLFLGRALEAAGIAAALAALDATYSRVGEPLPPPRLRRLLAAATPALLADARAWLGRVGDAYTAAAASSAATLGALIALKRASGPAYRLVGAAARRAGGARMVVAPPRHAPPPRPVVARAHTAPVPAPEASSAAAEAALKARLLELAGGQGTLPLVPPPHAAAC